MELAISVDKGGFVRRVVGDKSVSFLHLFSLERGGSFIRVVLIRR